jgi:hypothetical protein
VRLREFLLAAYQVEVGPNRRFFAFRLHQFVSAGGDVLPPWRPRVALPTLKGRNINPMRAASPAVSGGVLPQLRAGVPSVWAHLNKRPVQIEPRDFG